MSETQQFAAALTFGNRRALCNAYGLVLVGEDNDGAGKVKPAGPSTLAVEPTVKEFAAQLWRILPATVAGKNKNWLAAKQFLVSENLLSAEEHGGDDHAPQLSVERFKQVLAKIREA
jgi:hypothetical protein